MAIWQKNKTAYAHIHQQSIDQHGNSHLIDCSIDPDFAAYSHEGYPPAVTETGPEPEDALLPVFVSIPHCGRFYPARFLEQCDQEHAKLRQTEDAYVDIIARGIVPTGVSVIQSNYV